MYQRALQGKEKARGPEHTSTLETVNNLGNLYKNLGRLDEAEKMYRRALQGFEKTLNPETIKKYVPALTVMQNLANLLQKTDKIEEAKELYLRVITGAKANFGHSSERYREIEKFENTLSNDN